MEWSEWEGKKVYIETRSNRRYTGAIIKVEISKEPFLVWLTLLSTQGNHITFVNSEISLIQEEQ